MARTTLLALALLGLIGTAALATGIEQVGVDGSSTQYPALIESPINNKPVKLVITGTALRKKYLFNVYTVASYVQAGYAIHNAEELAGADVPKQLHLVMERDVDGKDLAEAFRSAVRLNYVEPGYNAELDKLSGLLRAHSVKKGDHIWLTSLPGKGLHCVIVGKAEVFIPSSGFARAVWEIYLGPRNIGESIKSALVSRL